MAPIVSLLQPIGEGQTLNLRLWSLLQRNRSYDIVYGIGSQISISNYGPNRWYSYVETQQESNLRILFALNHESELTQSADREESRILVDEPESEEALALQG